ncbi:hypothetical protein MPH47_17260 [Psychrobacillus psychrodurans]|uniref:hypothetical protein n=1 Tax=Psychrobacillus psychrodurans TaxID=126157 RepID=UPI001F4EAE0D|nr:hypothetical protein [Psychrobacillus psychrodurans]MCK1998947.1 hypothetical protein [Psychrobacillus psychrodurans]
MVQTNNTSFDKYISYLKHVMPHSPWVKSETIHPEFIKVFNAIQDNLILTEINTDEAMFQSSESKEILFGFYKENILSILISWPTNHPGFISYNIRTACETLLKLVYSHLFPSKSYEEVSRTGFRYLKDDSKKITDGVTKESILKLCTLYGQSSKQIHGHSSSFSDGDLVINSYFETLFDDEKKFSNAIIELTDLYFILNKLLFGFSISNLRVNQRIKLHQSISSNKILLIR